ncbi:MAG: 6-phosphogluconolactonase [Actinobacteria bacterium]|nr:6-phosphogluconolactonase [Actinomycetota bacterium]
MMEVRLIVCGSADAAAEAAAATFAQVAVQAVAERGRFLSALSGGQTPRALYTLLADPRLAPPVAWERTHLFFVDERCVPPTDKRSNYGAVQDTGLLHRPLAGVYRMEGERPPPEAAAAYEAIMYRMVSESADERCAVPQLDLVILGVGADGHTASLFPGSDATREGQRLVLATTSPDGLERVTLTFPVLWAARHTLLLVTGGGKATVVEQVLSAAGEGHGGQGPPAARAIAGARAATVLLDREAASLLSKDALEAAGVCGLQ